MDAFTLAHMLAAERTHSLGWWFLRGSDLRLVLDHTPFWIEDHASLWTYYEGLPLDSRPDRLMLFRCSVELLRSTGMLPRDQHPWLRRLTDAYTVVLTASCFFPCRFYYSFHKLFWSYFSWRAHQGVREAPTPLFLSSDIVQGVIGTVNGFLGDSQIKAQQSGVAAPSNNTLSRLLPALLVSSTLLLGSAAYLLGHDGRRHAWLVAQQKWDELRGMLDTSMRRVHGSRLEPEFDNTETRMQVLRQQP